jgi:hypothetical protein
MTPPSARTATVVPARWRGRSGGLALVLTGCFLLASCQAAPAPQPGTADAPANPNNAGYSLLYGLLCRQQDVDEALWLHNVDPPAAAAIKEIARTCGEARQQLRAFARGDAGLQLKTPTLPKVEQETRDAIASTETRVLLTSAGDTFRLRLLLTQNKSMEYASHLAGVLARNEPSRDRREYLEGLSQKLDALNDKMIHLLTVPGPGT